MPLACVVGRAHDASSKGKTRPLSSKDTTGSSQPALEIIALCMQPGTAAESALFHRCSQKDSIRTPSIHKRTGCCRHARKSHIQRAGEQSSPQVTVQSTHASRRNGQSTGAIGQHSQCPQSQQPPRRRRPEIENRRQRTRRPRPHRDRHHKPRRTAHRGA